MGIFSPIKLTTTNPQVPAYYTSIFGPFPAITHATYVDPDDNYRVFRVEHGFKRYLTGDTANQHIETVVMPVACGGWNSS